MISISVEHKYFIVYIFLNLHLQKYYVALQLHASWAFVVTPWSICLIILSYRIIVAKFTKSWGALWAR